MAERAPTAVLERVLIAFDASAHPRPVLEAATLLAARTRRALEALLVENAELFSVAELPFSREVERRHGTPRALDADTLARALQARRRQLERALAAMETPERPRPGLRVVRGRYLPEVLAAAAGFDAVLLGMGGPLIAPAAGQTPARRRRARAIWVLCDDTAATARATAVAEAVAAAAGSGLVLAGKEADEKGPPPAPARTGPRIAVRRVQLAEADRAHPGPTLLREGASLLVVCRERAASGDEGGLLAGVPCPVLIVS